MSILLPALSHRTHIRVNHTIFALDGWESNIRPLALNPGLPTTRYMANRLVLNTYNFSCQKIPV